MPRKILVVANQRKLAGRRKELYDSVVGGLRALGHDVAERAVTPAAEAAAPDLSSEALAFDQVVIAGGDGTVNRVLQGWDSSEVPLALVPLGTCNLVARECGYPKDASGIISVIDEDRRMPIYVAWANGVACAIAAGCGLDSFILDSIAWRWKKRLGRVYVAWKSCVGILRYRSRRFEVRVDGSPVHGSSVFILKGRYYAGPFSISDEASLFEPCLFGVVNEHPSLWRLLVAGAAMFMGNTRRVGEILTIKRAREVEITGPAGFPVHLDGDVRLRTPVRIVVSERPLLMCVPGNRPDVSAVGAERFRRLNGERPPRGHDAGEHAHTHHERRVRDDQPDLAHGQRSDDAA